MVQRWFAALCILVMAAPAPAQAQQSSIQDRVAQSRPGSRLRVRLRDGSQIEGKLASFDDLSFVVQGEKYLLNKRPEPVTVLYRDVQALKVNPLKSWVKGVIIAGTAVGVLMVAVLVNCRTNRFEC